MYLQEVNLKLSSACSLPHLAEITPNHAIISLHPGRLYLQVPELPQPVHVPGQLCAVQPTRHQALLTRLHALTPGEVLYEHGSRPQYDRS